MADPVLAWSFIAVGSFAQGVALVLARGSLRRLRSGSRVQGRVVDNVEAMIEGSKGGPRRFYFPVIEFDAGHGQTQRFQSQTGRGAPAPVGGSLPVAFDPKRPGSASEATFRSLWMFPLLASLAGLPFLAAGLAALP